MRAMPFHYFVLEALAGLFAARRLPEKAFNFAVYGLSFVAGVLLFF